MPPLLAIGKPLPYSKTFSADLTARSFWRLSYTCGRNYLDGMDARGQPVLVRHEREKPDAYSRRQRITKPRNHCGPLLRRYNDFVFRRAPTLPPNPGPLYDLIVKDADGQGTPLSVFLRRALMRAQVEREVFILPDSTAPADGAERSLAQAQAMGIRPVLRLIGSDSVVWSEDRDGVLVSAIVLMEADGENIARWFTAEGYCDIGLRYEDENASTKPTVTSIGSVTRTDYGACALVRLRPHFDQLDDAPGDSQIAPLAESQQMISNLLSLLYEEVCNVTFSQMVASGVSADAVKDVEIGNNRLICLPNPQASVQFIGADPEQAKTISNAIVNEERELYRQAGVSMGDPLASSGAPESGVAKAFKFNDLAANLSALADAVEVAHNGAMSRLCIGNGVAYPGDAIYPDDFDMPDYGAEMLSLIQTMSTSALPAVIRATAAKQFADRNLNLDEAQDAQLNQQLESLDAVAQSAASTLPFPNTHADRMTGT